jgi:hypothetical protein
MVQLRQMLNSLTYPRFSGDNGPTRTDFRPPDPDRNRLASLDELTLRNMQDSTLNRQLSAWYRLSQRYIRSGQFLPYRLKVLITDAERIKAESKSKQKSKQ